MKDKERKIGFLMALIVSAVMGAAASFIVVNFAIPKTAAENMPLPVLYGGNIILSVILGLLIARFIPLGKFGGMLCAKAHAAPPNPKFFLLNAIPMAVGNTLIIGTILSCAGIAIARMKMPEEILAHVPPFAVMWFGSWIKVLIPTLILSYVISVILAPILAKIFGVGAPPERRGR